MVCMLILHCTHTNEEVAFGLMMCIQVLQNREKLENKTHIQDNIIRDEVKD